MKVVPDPWRLVLTGSYALMAGLLIGRATTRSTYFALVVSVIVLTIALRTARKKVVLVWWTALFVAIGIWRAQSFTESQSVITDKIGSVATITGTIREDPSPAKNGKDLVVLDDLLIDQVRSAGRVSIQTSTTQQLRRSDRITVTGLMSEGRGSIVATIFDAELLGYEPLSKNDQGLAVRDWFSKNVRKYLSEPYASLGLGFLVGEKSSLPEELTLDLRLTGLTHIIVASGFNLTILAVFIRKASLRISRFFALSLGIASVVGFVAVSGNGPSMVRAGIVTILSLLAWYFGRSFMPTLLIGVVGAITSFYYPEYIWGDVGWYLSFLAFTGVLVVAPRVELYFFGDRPKGNVFRSALIESVSAVALTLPYSLYVFGQISLVSLAANMVVVPVIPIAMLATFATGIFSAIVPPIGQLCAYLTEAILRTITFSIEFLAGKDPGYTIDTLSSTAVLVMYVLVILGYLYIHRKTQKTHIEVQNYLDDA